MLYAYTAVNSREREMEDSHFRRGNCWMLREQVRQPCTLVREPMLGRGEASSMFRALKMIIEHVKRGFESSNEPCRAQILDTEILPGDQVSRLVFASPLLSLLARNLIDTPLDMPPVTSSPLIYSSIHAFFLSPSSYIAPPCAHRCPMRTRLRIDRGSR